VIGCRKLSVEQRGKGKVGPAMKPIKGSKERRGGRNVAVTELVWSAFIGDLGQQVLCAYVDS